MLHKRFGQAMSKKVKFKSVVFDLPYLIFVKDSMKDPELQAWFDAVQRGDENPPYSPYAPALNKPGHMIVGGGVPIYLPPEDLAKCYVIAVPPIWAGLRFLRRVNPNRSITLMGEVPGDRTGKASFSTVKVIFNGEDIDATHIHDMKMFAETAVVVVNRFLEHYRIVADRPYIQPITPQVIQDFKIETTFDDDSCQVNNYGTGSGPMHGLGGAISDDQDSKLRDVLSKDSPPLIYASLDADVRDHLDLQKWRLAVIESAVLFEAWVTDYVRQKYKLSGISDNDIDSKFLNKSGFPISVTAIVKNLIKEATGFDFAASNECLAWEKNVRDLRNGLVHGKIFDVSKDEATEAYKVVRECIKKLISK